MKFEIVFDKTWMTSHAVVYMVVEDWNVQN